VNVLGPVLRGAVAGGIGTPAMDVLWYARGAALRLLPDG
jgi:hypothetical protein